MDDAPGIEVLPAPGLCALRVAECHKGFLMGAVVVLIPYLLVAVDADAVIKHRCRPPRRTPEWSKDEPSKEGAVSPQSWEPARRSFRRGCRSRCQTESPESAGWPTGWPEGDSPR